MIRGRSNVAGTTVYNLLSPERIFCKGYRDALTQMIQKKYSKQNIEKMRKCMKTDGWLSDPSLPKSWLFKFQSEVYQSYSFIDAEGKHLSSKVIFAFGRFFLLP